MIGLLLFLHGNVKKINNLLFKNKGDIKAIHLWEQKDRLKSIFLFN